MFSLWKLSKHSFIIILLALSPSTHGQVADPCIHHQRNNAIKAFEANEPKLVVQYYDRFLNLGGRLNAWDLLKLARSYMDLGDTAECIHSLRLGIEHGLVWSEKDNFLSIEHAFTKEQLEGLDRDHIGYEHHHQSHLDRLDTLLIQKIEDLVRADQQIRYPRQDLMAGVHGQLIQRQDSITRSELRPIFGKNNGFPASGTIDRRTSFGLSLLIHHVYRTFPDEYEYLLQIVLQAVNSFQLHPGEYATMVDRHQYKIDGTIVYGEVPRHTPDGASVEHVKDPATVDVLRSSAGLGSLKDHCIEQECRLPAGYIERPSPCMKE